MPARRKATDSEGNVLTAEEKILKDLRQVPTKRPISCTQNQQLRMRRL